jgi:polar amino acid transport system substrate-binding protein
MPFLIAILSLWLLGVGLARADPAPNLWDPNLRLDTPDLTSVRAIRFLTADDYPPLDFTRADGALTGFNVEIARALCEQLRTPCTIQARRWDTLVDALKENRGDAMIASMRATPALRADLDFTAPYYLTPARFAARADFPSGAFDAAALKGRKVGVAKGGAHEKYLAAFFPEANLSEYKDFAALGKALKAGEIDLMFADGLTTAVWLAGEDSAGCCGFRGGPYLESRYFGAGVSIGVRKTDEALRRALDYALAKVAESGQYAEIYRKYFPVSFY